MIFYYSNPYMDGPHYEDISGEDYMESIRVALSFSSWGLDDEVIYVGF